MKFLAHGDSVVALRFKFKGLESIGEAIANEITDFDNLADIQKGLDNVFPEGFDVPQSLKDQMETLVEAVNDPKAEIDQNWIASRLGQIQGNINVVLDNRGDADKTNNFMDKLNAYCSEFLEHQEQALIKQRGELGKALEAKLAQVKGIDQGLAGLEERVESNITAAKLIEKATEDPESIRNDSDTLFAAVNTTGANFAEDWSNAKDAAASLLDQVDNTSLISSSSLMAGLDSAEAMAAFDDLA